MWTKDLHSPSTAPRDGTKFVGIRKGRFEPVKCVFDGEMGCFAEIEDVYAPFDELSAWMLIDAALAEAPVEELEERE